MELTQFFPLLILWFLCCDSNLDLQSNLPRLSACLIDLTNFFLWKILDIVLEYWKLSKPCFIIGRTFGLLELYVMKGKISSFLAAFVCLKISRGISLALNMLASIRNFGYFCSSNVIFSSLKRFSFTFSFSTMIHILLAKENGIFVKQYRGWFDVNGTYRVEYVSLL